MCGEESNKKETGMLQVMEGKTNAVVMARDSETCLVELSGTNVVQMAQQSEETSS